MGKKFKNIVIKREAGTLTVADNQNRTFKISEIDEHLLELYWSVKWTGTGWYVSRDTRSGKGGKIRGRIFLHRTIVQTDLEVDHIDCDPTNNTRENLREATTEQNRCNKRKVKGDSYGTSSKYKGVHWNKDKQKWDARIRFE